ncbi:PhzF family phenazine biosynthesis protein [Micromonospora sp. NPDC048843]|uniref:PhzF family phenazine biosynthesis protein n=1 Tax=Micromonospora sp. NPDC048843 TaxID=3155389 RepID=UPI0033C37E02
MSGDGRGARAVRQLFAVAWELNNSETAFVLPADAADHDVQVRFFAPTTEVPTCGHDRFLNVHAANPRLRATRD